MVCDCCLKRKRLFESFAAVQTEKGTMHLCTDCNDLAYKIRDDANAKDVTAFEEHLAKMEKRALKAKPIFIEWEKGFITGLRKQLAADQNQASKE